jgi:hypothetical protein
MTEKEYIKKLEEENMELVQNLNAIAEELKDTKDHKYAYNFDFEHADELIEIGRQAVLDNETKIKKKFSSWYDRI